MNNLYIIGNGFDLHHNLKTTYYHFKQYLREKREDEFLALLENCFDSKNLWNNFEEALGSVEPHEYRDGRIYLHDSENNINKKLANFLKNYMCLWLLSIDTSIAKRTEKLIPINPNSTFITFNYTDTLEIVYDIKKENIIYLHGKCKKKKNSIFYKNFNQFEYKLKFSKKNYSNIIIGHNTKDWLAYNDYEIFYESLDEGYKYGFNKHEFNKISKFLVEMKKNPSYQMENHRNIFQNIAKFHRLIILGHSLGDVDYEYFNAIFNTINNNAKIIISYYDDESLKNLKVQLKNFKINRKVEFIELKNIPYYT